MSTESSRKIPRDRRPGWLFLASAIGVCFACGAANPVHARGLAAVSTDSADVPKGNGIIRSGRLNHAILRTSSGTTLNIVSNVIHDGGPIDDLWDFNFFRARAGNYIGDLFLWEISASRYAVDANGEARVFAVGAEIGPDTPFSTGSGPVAMSAQWLAGADGYLGVKFNCDGRLSAPVSPPGVCYGYVHLTTTAPNGFTAKIADTAFDGDGQPIAVESAPPSPGPVADVTPVGLDATITAGTTGSDTLVISNIGGSDLTYSIVESKPFDGEAPIEARPANGLASVTGCDDPGDIPWLNPGSSSGTVAPGESVDVVTTVDAAVLVSGHYLADLCVTTNDPQKPLVAIPFRLNVVAADVIFCSTFEEGGNGSCETLPPPGEIVYSSMLNVSIPQTGDGLSINYLTGQASPTETPGFDFNPYFGAVPPQTPRLLFYWGGLNFNYGVAATVSGPYLVLGPGDVVGPSSTFTSYANGANDETRLFLVGVTGYLGVMFTSEETGQILYGYVHIHTTAGDGFPATILDYAYDKSGAAITIP